MASAAAMTTMAMRAVLVAVVLMQCCNVMVAARPLLMEAPAVATSDGGGWLGMIMQVLQGGNNSGCRAPNGSCP